MRMVSVVAVVVFGCLWAAPAMAFDAAVWEETMDNLERRLDELAQEFAEKLEHLSRRVRPEESLDRTLRLTVEATGHEPLSILCATTEFVLESEENSEELQQDESKEVLFQGEGNLSQEHSELLIEGTITQSDKPDTYLVTFNGSYFHHSEEITAAKHARSNEDRRLEFHGSALIQPGDEQVLVEQGGRSVKVTLAEVK